MKKTFEWHIARVLHHINRTRELIREDGYCYMEAIKIADMEIKNGDHNVAINRKSEYIKEEVY